jgi:hypothetical protein
VHEYVGIECRARGFVFVDLKNGGGKPLPVIVMCDAIPLAQFCAFDVRLRRPLIGTGIPYLLYSF